jgi:hypothetical protein
MERTGQTEDTFEEDEEEKAIRLHLQKYANVSTSPKKRTNAVGGGGGKNKTGEGGGEFEQIKAALLINLDGTDENTTSGSETLLSSISHVDLGDGKEGNTSTSTNALFPYLGGGFSSTTERDEAQAKIAKGSVENQ